jgi:hypothetical protein
VWNPPRNQDELKAIARDWKANPTPLEWNEIKIVMEGILTVLDGAPKLCPITSADGWLMCTLPAGHVGLHDLRSVHLGDAQTLTADTITDQDLRDLFAKHCACRDLNCGIDFQRREDDHAAIHDCDTAILRDIQIALGIISFGEVGKVDRVQAIREARERCAETINAERRVK